MSWTAPAMLDALKERFDNWADLNDVEVFTEPVFKLNKTENIVFVRVRGEQEWAALGQRTKKDSYTIEGLIHVVRKGATQAKAKEARDRAFEIADALSECLLDTLDHLDTLATDIGANQVHVLSLVGINYEPGGSAGQNRTARIDFDIDVEARI